MTNQNREEIKNREEVKKAIQEITRDIKRMEQQVKRMQASIGEPLDQIEPEDEDEDDEIQYQLHINKLGTLIIELIENYEKQHDLPFDLRLDVLQQLRDTLVIVLAEQCMQDEAAEAVKQ